jgi:arylsulfatase A-like enzyme
MPRALEDANGVLVGGPELLVLPQGDWRPRDGLVSPARVSSIPLFVVDRRSERADLVVTIEGLRADGSPVAVRWNGRRVEDARPLGPDAFGVDVPRARLSGGLDLLELVLPGQPSKPAELRAVRWTSGAETGRIDAGSLGFLRSVSNFLEYGVAGSEPALEGGILVVGDETVRLKTPARRGTLRFAVRNLAGGASSFVARHRDGGGTRNFRGERLAEGALAEFEVATEGGGLLTLERSPGDHRSLALWVQPRIVEPRVRVPLILLITLDTTRRDALGSYDPRVEWTPRLDRLAARATVYEHAVSTTSWTLPAHASIFTGRFPREHGAGVSAPALPFDADTIARLLADRYLTVGFAGGPLMRHTFGVGRGFARYRVAAANEMPGAEVAELAIRTMRESGGEPLFLFLNFFDPHFPFSIRHDSGVGAAARAAAAALPEGSAGRRLAAGEVGAWLDAIEQRLRPEPEEVAALRLAYAAEVEEMDRQIGRVLDELERSGRFDDAMIVAVADHGELLGERGLFSHAVRLEPELTSIPLIVKYPGQQAAERVPELVSLVDLYPTLLRAAGLRPPPSSGLALTDRVSLGQRDHVMLEEHESVVHPFYQSIQLGPHLVGLESRRERMVRWRGGEQCWGRVDPGWTEIGCDEPGRLPVFAQRLRGLPLRPPAASAESRDIDAADRARLRALGYL